MDDVQVRFRLTKELHERLKTKAREDRRSLQGEIEFLLERALFEDDVFDTKVRDVRVMLEAMKDELEERIRGEHNISPLANEEFYKAVGSRMKRDTKRDN